MFGGLWVPRTGLGRCHPQQRVRDWAVLGVSTGRILQKDEGLNVLLSIPDSAKVVAFKPEHPGLWSIKVGGLGFPGLGRPASPAEIPSLSGLGHWEAKGILDKMWAYQQK